jgi:hypothetical protein
MKYGKFTGHKNINRLDGSTTDSWESYRCAYCGTAVSGAVVARFQQSALFDIKWLQCPHCANGSVLDSESRLHPSPRFGPSVVGLPKDVSVVYDEARDSMAVNAFTGTELICRKILMHVAVEKGAGPGESFAKYVTHLEDQGYVTPPMKGWVDQIRKIGNAAAHELTPPDRRRAESTMMFTAELLRLVYEMEALTKKYTEARSDE